MNEELKIGDRVKDDSGQEGIITAVRPQFDTRFGGGRSQFLDWQKGCLVRRDGEGRDGWYYLHMLKLIAHAPDTVNYPAHYTQGTIECIDYILDKKMDYLEGNVVKYITRYKDKNGVEDLKKARRYLDRLIQREEKSDGK